MGRDRLNELSFTFLYFNLGGEMMYIINQRLIAQQTTPDKSQRGKRRRAPSCSFDLISSLSVIDDILVSFLSLYHHHLTRFMDSPSKLGSSYLKNTFESITSSSPIMRLTQSSYHKLFDLIVGVLKFQVARAPFPSSLLHITNNHMDSMRDLALDLVPPTINLVKRNIEMLNQIFKPLNQSEWNAIRNLILSAVFSDLNIRISILLREGLQDMETGSFTIPADQGVDSIRISHYDDEGDVLMQMGSQETVDDSSPLGLDM